VTPDVLSANGLAALRQLDARRSVLAFDYDGTLAPIVLQPADAVVPQTTAARLRELSGRWPVAVITGRRVDDVVDRLGFAPRFLAGNHGAESRHAPLDVSGRRALDACRGRLRIREQDLRQQGITLEDKGLSLALHCRGAIDRPAAIAWLQAFSTGLGPELTATLGHCVLNIVLAHAWDKGDALQHFMQQCNASACLMIGDDINDEPAFAKAPTSSVTVRIGPADTLTAARFSMASPLHLNQLLDVLLDLHV
jgi:trehalose 6-phosphate phosphatase